MFELLDNPSAIREVQKFLYEISDKVDNRVGRVAIDGIYGKETKDAVTSFQDIYKLKKTGEVDRATFDKMFSVYKDSLSKREFKDFIITQKGFPFKQGDQNDDVLVINLILNELKRTFPNITSVEKSSYYSYETANAVRDLQKIIRFLESGEVDENFYRRMQEELNASDRLYEVYK